MKKISYSNKILFYIIVASLFINACSSIINSKSQINNYKIELIEYNNQYDECCITGDLLHSALWIEKYEITYYERKVILKIKTSLKPTGLSMYLFVKFLVPKESNEIFLCDELIWVRQ